MSDKDEITEDEVVRHLKYTKTEIANQNFITALKESYVRYSNSYFQEYIYSKKDSELIKKQISDEYKEYIKYYSLK